MDNTLALYHHLYLLCRQAEQPDSLDQLQPFVHQRGGINGDLASHTPIGMAQRIVLCNILQLLPRAAEKRPAGGRQQYLLQAFGRVFVL